MIILRWDEAKTVEAAAGSLRNRVVVRLCLYAGLRAHEVADARIEHIDPVNGWIYIPHGHNNGPRFVAIDSQTVTLLSSYVGPRKKGPLITHANGERIGRWSVYYIVRSTGEKSLIRKGKPIGPVMLRHTFATTWLRRKGNIRLLQQQLGHKQIRSTGYYLDFLPEEVKSEHSALFESEVELVAPESARSVLRQILQPMPNY